MKKTISKGDWLNCQTMPINGLVPAAWYFGGSE